MGTAIHSHLLIELIKCSCCHGALKQVNAQSYGCRNAKRKLCSNKQILSREHVEAIILDDLRKKFLPDLDGMFFGDRRFYVEMTTFQTLALLAEEAKE